jgi:hypothetical protein
MRERGFALGVRVAFLMSPIVTKLLHFVYPSYNYIRKNGIVLSSSSDILAKSYIKMPLSVGAVGIQPLFSILHPVTSCLHPAYILFWNLTSCQKYVTSFVN